MDKTKSALREKLKGEFLGMYLDVVHSKNNHLVGLKGLIIDETKESFVIVTDDGKHKRLLKSQIVFTISRRGLENSLDTPKLEIDGKNIVYRSHDRIKKIR